MAHLEQSLSPGANPAFSPKALACWRPTKVPRSSGTPISL